MITIDAQLHEPGPQLHWPEADPEARYRVLTEVALAWMDSVGVDRAVLQPVDPAWGDYAVKQASDRFASVPLFPALASRGKSPTELLAEYREANPNLLGARLCPTWPGEETMRDLEAGKYDAWFETCQEARLPVFLFVPHALGIVADLARKYPDLTLIVDHIGIPQPPIDNFDTPRWKALPELLQLANFKNVAVKLCGAPSLSETGAPFSDVWPHLHQVIDAFGANRLMWASDQSRFFGRVGFQPENGGVADYQGKHNYAESIALFRDTNELSQADKNLILGGTVQSLLNWKRGSDQEATTMR